MGGPARLLLFACLALISFGIGYWAISPLTAVRIVKHFGYWTLLITVTSAGWLLLQTLLPDLRAIPLRFSKRHLFTFALIAASTLFLQTREPAGFKIIDDEIAILATARQMHFEREIGVPTRAHNILGVFEVMDADTYREEWTLPDAASGAHVDKRQPLFPFIVSLLHDFTGYRVENIFYLNLVLTPLFLLLIFLLGRTIGGTGCGHLGVLFAISTPLLSQSCNGAGPELLNLCLITGAILLSIRALDKPSSLHLSVLALSGVLLALTRYESVIFTAAVGIVYALAWKGSGRIITPPGLYAAPLLLIPYLLVCKAFQVYPGFWQLTSSTETNGPFSTAYAADNFQRFLWHFFDTSINQPNNFMLTVVGLLAIFALLLSAARRPAAILAARPATLALVGFLPAFGLLFLVMLFYAYSAVNDPIAHRLALPFIIPLIASSLVALYAPPIHRRLRAAVVLAACINFFLFAAPCASRHIYTDKLIPAQEVAWTREFIRDNRNRDYLMVATTSFLWISHGVQSITIERANQQRRKVQFQIDQQPAKNFYVIQKLDYNPLTGEEKSLDPVPLSPDFNLEPVADRFFTLYDFIRISRIISVRTKSEDRIEPQSMDLDSPGSAQRNLAHWVEQLP